MATILGGSRWNDEITSTHDDWWAYKIEMERQEDPTDMDYVKEEYRDEEN